MKNMHDLIIVGGGPAGLTAALYAGRAGKSVLVLEKNNYGGQITWSPRVENFPAAGTVSGIEFADSLTEQVMSIDSVDLELDEAVDIKRDEERIFTVKTAFGDIYSSKALIDATGAAPRKLGAEGEERLTGHGVSYCAVCDGDFYRGKTAAVAGGGNSALQEAIYLSDICSRVYLIHRRDAFRADDILVDAAEKRENIIFILEAQIASIDGSDNVKHITVNYKDDRKETLDVSALFIAIGHVPVNDIFRKFTDLDEEGYADNGEDCSTYTPGFFTAGDCRKKEVRQLTTAAADGAVAALAACRYIDSIS